MAKILPFRPLRATKEHVAAFSASAFDSDVREDELRKQGHDANYLRILSPRLFSQKPLSDEEAYDTSLATISNLLTRGILEQEQADSIFVYRQNKGNDTFTCFIGLTSIDEYMNGKILKHELTRTDKEEKITEYFRHVGINGSPVLLTYPDRPRLHEMLLHELTEPQPLYHFEAEGIEHLLWRVSDEWKIQEIRAEFDAIEALYIADGHHRCAALGHLFNETDDFMACLIPDSLIRIHAFHRYIKELGMQPEVFLSKLGERFKVEKIAEMPVVHPGEIYLFLKDTWYSIGIDDSFRQSANPKHKLDVYILDRYIFCDILGIENTRSSKQVKFMNGEVSTEELIEPVKLGQMQAFFLLNPVKPEEVMQVAEYGETMPPKSTWIEPKLRSGLLIHQFKKIY